MCAAMFDMESNLALDEEFGLESGAVIFSGAGMLPFDHLPIASCCCCCCRLFRLNISKLPACAGCLCCKQLFSFRWA